MIQILSQLFTKSEANRTAAQGLSASALKRHFRIEPIKITSTESKQEPDYDPENPARKWDVVTVNGRQIPLRRNVMANGQVIYGEAAAAFAAA